MRFLLLCKRYYTNHDLLEDRFGRLFHLPVQLARQGHRGRVLAADYRHATARHLSLPGVEFQALPVNARRLPGFVRRLGREARAFGPDLVLASGDSYLGFLGLRLARRLGVPFAFDLYDDYAGFRSGRIPGMGGLLRYTLRRADLLITASHALGARYRRLNPALVTVENGVDLALFRPMPRAGARAALGLPGDIPVVGFFGSMEPGRGLDTLLAALARLRTRQPELRLLLAGYDAIGLPPDQPGIDYRGVLPQARIPELINACDVVTIPYPDNGLWRVCNPCKIAEYLACEVPVVATRVADHEKIFADAGQGLCRPEDPADMARAIQAQLQSPQRVAMDGRLSWEHLGERLAGALAGLSRAGAASTALESR